VEVEVLFAVHDSRDRLDRHHVDGRGEQGLENGDDGEHRRRNVSAAVRLDRVVGGRRILGEPLPGHLKPLVVGPAVQAGVVELQRFCHQ
jgi:hypothetical protein